MMTQDRQQTDREYEMWKREQGLDGRGFPNYPVLPSESIAARIANASAKAADDEREDD